MSVQLETRGSEALDLLLEPDLDATAADEDAPMMEKPQILAELLIEEVSIDGMCGVY